MAYDVFLILFLQAILCYKMLEQLGSICCEIQDSHVNVRWCSKSISYMLVYYIDLFFPSSLPLILYDMRILHSIYVLRFHYYPTCYTEIDFSKWLYICILTSASFIFLQWDILYVAKVLLWYYLKKNQW